MSKNTRWSPDDLRKKGLVQNPDGVYVPVKSLVATGKVEKIEPGKSLVERAGEYLAGIDVSNRKITTAVAALPKLTPEQMMHNLNQQGFIFVEATPPNRLLVDFTPDLRDMEQIGRAYLSTVGQMHTRANINRAIKLIRCQEAEDFLINLNKLTDFYIPGEVRSTKNHTRIMKRKDGTRFIGKGAATMAAEKVQVWDYKAGAAAFREATKNLPFPLFVKFTFIMSTDAHFDYLNLTQGPADLMQKCGWIRNDSRKHIVPIFNPIVYVHPEKAGVVISVL